MAHLLNIWPSVSARLRRSGRVLLLFDYDGTLTPIVARPKTLCSPMTCADTWKPWPRTPGTSRA